MKKITQTLKKITTKTGLNNKPKKPNTVVMIPSTKKQNIAIFSILMYSGLYHLCLWVIMYVLTISLCAHSSAGQSDCLLSSRSCVRVTLGVRMLKQLQWWLQLSWLERRVVVSKVAGSNPVSHPTIHFPKKILLIIIVR